MARPRLKSDLEKVLEILPRLDSDELKQVGINLRALSQFNKVEYQEQVEDYILSGIMYEIERRGMRETIPFPFRIRNRSSFNAYGRKAEAIRMLLERHAPGLTLVEKAALGRLCARSLAEYMESWSDRKSIEFSSLLYNVEHIPAALDGAFPGYLSNGALGLIVRALSNPTRAYEAEAWDGEGEDAFDC